MFMEDEPDPGEVRAEWVVGAVASWWFAGGLLVGIGVWLGVNVAFRPFQPYPEVMLAGLAAVLAIMVALQGPLILHTQRRADRRDRERERETYLVAAHTEADIHDVRTRLDELARLRVTDSSEERPRQPAGSSSAVRARRRARSLRDD
jgi:uncharacterized membrane protein